LSLCFPIAGGKESVHQISLLPTIFGIEKSGFKSVTANGMKAYWEC
jgi:hypothetical protein